jgi:RHS repeat-associated protein
VPETAEPVQAGAASNYAYDAYGRVVASFETVDNPYLFTGRELDLESGLYHYRARAYDPETGRFLQEDPLGFAAGDLNLYRYVLNDPVNLVDPFGLYCLSNVAIAAISGAAGGAVTGAIGAAAGGPLAALAGAAVGAAVGGASGAFGEAIGASGPIGGAALGAAGAAAEAGIAGGVGRGGIIGGGIGGAVGGPGGGAVGGFAGGLIDTRGNAAQRLGGAIKAGRAGLYGGIISLGVEYALKAGNDCSPCGR